MIVYLNVVVCAIYLFVFTRISFLIHFCLVTEVHHGQMVDLNTDWQTSTQIWDMPVSIPGVLQGDLVPSSVHVANTRHSGDMKRGYIYGTSLIYKT